GTPPRGLVERVDEIGPHGPGAVRANEGVRVGPVLEVLHRLADHVLPVARVELRVGAAGDDEVDLRHGHDTHLAAHLDRDALEILAALRRRPLSRAPRVVVRALALEYREQA